ncbi:MAG: DNA-directed RNA polymerase subunit omega [Nitrospinota bacterium]
MIDSVAYAAALKVIPQKYLLVNIISKRLRQLQRGAEPKIPKEECEGLPDLQIALKEISTAHISLLDECEA